MNPVDIKYLIAKKGESIATLARRFGCHRQQLSYCIHGDRQYRVLEKKLAKFLGLSVRELFGDAQHNKRAA